VVDDILELWDYRRRVTALYDGARAGGAGEAPWRRWREGRDELFRTHPQSPLPEGHPSRAGGLPFGPYDPAWRVTGALEPLPPAAAPGPAAHSGAGETPMAPAARVRAVTPAGDVELVLWWLEGYGGGAFLPFRDATNGEGTYGGGRYLLDTAKGADLGHEGRQVVLDFNYAYHPSCAHDPRWSCPLAPPENRLAVAVPVGEQLG
jgi:hypothetical protein